MGLSDDIRDALEARLATAAAIPAADHRAGENAAFDPPIGETWLRGTLLFGAKTRVTMPAAAAYLVHDGLYLVDVFHPQDAGPVAADTLADALLAVFQDGLQLTTPSGTLRITRSTRRGGIRDDGWYQVPLEVGWQIETINPL